MGALASGTDTWLVIEVSDTTLRYDRDVKIPLYARHGVHEVWIVDVQGEQLLSFGALRDGRYEQQAATPRPARAAITALPGTTVDLSGLFANDNPRGAETPRGLQA